MLHVPLAGGTSGFLGTATFSTGTGFFGTSGTINIKIRVLILVILWHEVMVHTTSMAPTKMER